MLATSISLVLATLAQQLPGPAGPALSPGDGHQGMAAAHQAASKDNLNRRVCLTERASGRQVCRTMEAWRVEAQRLETEQR